MKREDINEQTGKSSNSYLVNEKCTPIKEVGKNSSCHSDEACPSLPTQYPESRSTGKHFLSMSPLKLPPSLKRQPMFSLIPNTNEQEETDLYDKVEQGVQLGNKTEQEIPEMKKEAIVTPMINPTKSCEAEIKESHCPICLDNYGKMQRFIF